MTYCTVKEVGQITRGKGIAARADLTIIRAAAARINGFLGFDGLYEPESTWSVPAGEAAFARHADGTSNLYLGFPVIDLNSVKVYLNETLVESFVLNAIQYNGAFFTPTVRRSYSQLVALEVTGTRGHAVFKALSAGAPLQAGQNVLRAGARVLIEADGQAQADDVLLQPPPELNHMAVTIARDLMAMERGKAFGGDMTVLPDNFRLVLARYR